MTTTLPKPDILNAYLDDITSLGDQIKGLYRWLEPNAYSRPRHGSSGGGRIASSQCRRCHGDGRLDYTGSVCPDCDGDGVLASSNDRVGNEVIATEHFRVKLRHAAREVQDARNRLYSALADCNDAAKLLEPPATTTDQHERSLPHPADQGDLARARAAQQRRQERAEQSGSWDEVVGG